MSDIRRMQLGQVVDFCIAYNKRVEESEKRAEREAKKPPRHRASQDEINAFFG